VVKVKIQNILYTKKHSFKGDACKNCKGMTLMELIVAMGISAILITVIVGFTTNIVIQYTKQKEAGQNTAKVLYLTQVFNTVDQWPEVRVKADNGTLKITDNTVSPSKETVYYVLQGSIYKDEFTNGVFKNTILLGKNYSINFSLVSDVSYLKNILKVDITDGYGQIWSRKISLRDSEVVATY
jgi:prepilin-type N-terminal cleavage/methylation domain-containing protein